MWDEVKLQSFDEREKKISQDLFLSPSLTAKATHLKVYLFFMSLCIRAQANFKRGGGFNWNCIDRGSGKLIR